MKQFALTIGAVLCAASMCAQAHSDEEQVIASAPSAVSPAHPLGASGWKVARAPKLHDSQYALRITLPPLAHPPKSAPANTGGPLEVSIERPMPAQYKGSLKRLTRWVQTQDGGIATQATVTSPGATDMRVGVRVNLPPGAEMRFFGERQMDYPVITRKDLSWKGLKPLTLWSPIVVGSTIGVEIALPSAQSRPDLEFAIDAVLHGFLEGGGFGPMPKLCPGHVDVQCRLDRDDVPLLLRSVARISIRADSGGGRACSGNMLNDIDTRHFMPLFLTANHCVSSQSEANSIVARWNYMTASCGSSQTHSEHFRTDFGARLLETSPSQDASLLLFNHRARRPITFAAWSSVRIPHRKEVFGLHHPGGSQMKYSAGTRSHFETINVCEDPDARIGCQRVYNAVMVDWTEGYTEGGSSGSGLFMLDEGEHRLVGVLSGGDNCSQQDDIYGNFRDYFPRVERYLYAATSPLELPPLEEEVIVDDHGNSSGTATHVQMFSSTSGTINPAGDPDWFRVSVADRGQIIAWTTGSTDTVGTLFQEHGGSLIQRAHDDDSGERLNFSIVEDAEPGVYFVEVKGYNSSRTVGDYTLHVGFEPETIGPPDQILPMVLPVEDASRGRFSYVRIRNKSARAGEVTIYALDDTGARYGPLPLMIGARQALSFDSPFLENAVGPGNGYWHLEVRSDLNVEAFAYMGYTGGGPITSAHEVAEGIYVGEDDDYDDLFSATDIMPEKLFELWEYTLPFFNPGSNRRRVSWLRLVNPTGIDAEEITIRGLDDTGSPGPGGMVTTSLPANGSRMLSAQALEGLVPNDGMTGQLGDGSGKWELTVISPVQLQVMSLVITSDGVITNMTR